MADLIPWSNLLPQYQSPQAMALTNAQTGETQAQTGLLGEQAAGADIANQSAGLKLGLLQDYLGGGSGGATPGTPSPAPTGGAPPSMIGGTGVDAGDVTQHAISQFAPIPTARPPSVLQSMQRAAMAGMPDAFVQNIGAQYDAQVQSINQQKQLGANGAYQVAEQVANAPPGTALEKLSLYNPQAAAAVKAQHPSDDPEELDQDVRTYAQHVGIATHQYSGRDTDFQNGVLVDKKDGKPVLGSEQVLTGLDAGAKAKAFTEANERVDVPTGIPGQTTQVPRWRQAGFSSAEGYVVAADRSARSSAANGDDGSAPGAAPAAAAPGNTLATHTPAPATPAAPTVTDPVLKTALADPDYKLPAPKITPGTTASAADVDQAKATVQAKTDLMKDAQAATSSSAQALQYLQAAKSIQEAGGVPTGASADLKSKISAAAAALGIGSGVDATNYEEISKYLLNAGVQAGKANFGSSMTEAESKQQTEHMSPNAGMQGDALKNLIAANIRQQQYQISSAQRVRPYLASNGDPQSFNEWNEKHFQRADAINQPPPAQPTRPGQQSSGRSIVRTGTLNGRKVVQYSDGTTGYAQ